MRFLSEITNARGFAACLVLTYNLDLAWFERLIARQLRARGVRHFLILADGARLSDTLEAQVALLNELGRSYVVLGMAPPCFHPKAMLLTGERAARLYVGSGNLTHAGYGRNREVFESWEVGEADPSLPMAFERLRLFVEQVVNERTLGNPSEAVVRCLDAVFGARSLRKPVEEEASRELLASPGPLMSRLPAPPSPATSLTMVAPSFDRDGSLVVDLADRLGAGGFDVITDTRTTNLPKEALGTIEARGGRVSRIDDKRRLHAKIVTAQGDGWQLAVTGSANLSDAAWRGLNHELVVLRRGDSALPVFSLLDQVARHPLSEDDRARLVAWAEPAPSASRGPELLDAIWVGVRQVQLRPATTPTGLVVEACHQGNLFRVESLERNGDHLVVTLPTDCERERPSLVRLVGAAGAGPWCAVHDVQELEERGRAFERPAQTLEGLYADGSGYDAAAGERLLELLVSTWRQRAEANRKADDGDDVAPADEPAPATDWVWLRESDFAVPGPSGQRPEDGGEDSRVMIPSRLLRRLLFGPDDDPDADELGEGESADPAEAELSDAVQPGSSSIAPPLLRSTGVVESFTAAADRALQQYLDLLRSGTVRTASRLLDDMQVLLGALHYGLSAGALSPSGFRRQLVGISRAFLGHRNAPFPSALERIASLDREASWRRAPLLMLFALAAYNLALAEVAVTPDDDPPNVIARSLGLSLWVRHAISATPAVVVQETLDRLPMEARRACRGALWLRPFEVIREQLPFAAFAEDLVRSSRAIHALERAIGPKLSSTTRTALEEGDQVLGLGRDGSLAIGHVEQNGRQLRAYLYDGAYQRADAQLGGLWEPMHVVDAAQRVVSTVVVRQWCDGLDEECLLGLAALERVR